METWAGGGGGEGKIKSLKGSVQKVSYKIEVPEEKKNRKKWINK